MENSEHINNNYPLISIIVACLNEEKYIKGCLDSLIAQDYKGSFEIIVVDGGSKDNTLEILSDYIEKYELIKLLNNPDKIQAVGRNIAVKETKANYFAYIDAHRIADNSWLSNLWDCYIMQAVFDENIVGVSSVHYDASGTDFSKAQEYAFRSIISGAGTNNFLNVNQIERVDHGCMCLYDKSKFVESGMYDESLPIGEDIEINHRFTYINKFNLYLNPKAVNYYHPRSNIQSLFKQQYNYGYWRQVVLSKLLKNEELVKDNNPFKRMKVKTLIPGIFVTFFGILFVLSFFSDIIFYAYYFLLLIYLLIITIISIRLARKYNLKVITLITVFLSIHFGYGSGVITYYFEKFKN